jgi:hypothetical protein
MKTSFVRRSEDATSKIKARLCLIKNGEKIKEQTIIVKH